MIINHKPILIFLLHKPPFLEKCQRNQYWLNYLLGLPFCHDVVQVNCSTGASNIFEFKTSLDINKSPDCRYG